MRIITFNVNGLRARIKAGWPSKEFLEKYDPDIICLQEVRAKPEQIPASFLPGYDRYSSVHSKAGYAGAWTFVKKPLAPLLSLDKFPVEGFEETGRAEILDFKYFKLINSYTPNSGSRLEKIAGRKDYEAVMFQYTESVCDLKPVIICGDLNVAPEKKDSNITCLAGTSPAERTAFSRYQSLNMIDIWQSEHPGETQFTFFSRMYDARENNKGMRLDHFLVDKSRINVEGCHILHDYSAGSDHTPVLLDVEVAE